MKLFLIAQMPFPHRYLQDYALVKYNPHLSPPPWDMVVLRKPIEQMCCPMGWGFLTNFDYIIRYTVISYLVCMLANNVAMGWGIFFVLTPVKSVSIPPYVLRGGGVMFE